MTGESFLHDHKKMLRWQQMGKSLKIISAVSSSLMNLLKEGMDQYPAIITVLLLE